MVMAMIVSARVAIEIPCGDLPSSATSLQKSLSSWPTLMPLSVRSLNALSDREKTRPTKARKKERPSVADSAPPTG